MSNLIPHYNDLLSTLQATSLPAVAPDETCPICHSVFQNRLDEARQMLDEDSLLFLAQLPYCLDHPVSDRPVRLPCRAGHIFGLACLKSWIKSTCEASICCPLCRDPLCSYSISEQDYRHVAVVVEAVMRWSDIFARTNHRLQDTDNRATSSRPAVRISRCPALGNKYSLTTAETKYIQRSDHAPATRREISRPYIPTVRRKCRRHNADIWKSIPQAQNRQTRKGGISQQWQISRLTPPAATRRSQHPHVCGDEPDLESLQGCNTASDPRGSYDGCRA
jgi:hypothetical protein